jgi:biopolymer transport protein ExbD
MGEGVGTTKPGEVMVEMNTTPLIDVMLVLLVILIVTLPLQTNAVKLDMPAPNATPPTVIPQTVDLGVDFDGTITWNSVPVDRATMDAYFLNAAQQDPQPEIHVNANRLAKYDAVALVLADAQRLGATHIGFTGIDQYN